VIGILEEFFIQFSDLFIKFLIGIIDLIILFANKFSFNNNFDQDAKSSDENKSNQANEFSHHSNSFQDAKSSDENKSKRVSEFSHHNKSKNEIDFVNKGIFNITHSLRNDSIFEELEKRYFNSSSSNMSNQSKSNNIFTSLNIENSGDYTSFNENDGSSERNSLENLKERLFDFLMNNGFLRFDESNFLSQILKLFLLISIFILMIIVLISYFISLEFGLAILITFLLMGLTVFYYPKIKKQKGCSSFSRELPYALRQLATELRSGKSLFDSMDSIAHSHYGTLSLEFSRVLEEIKYGESTENAFLNLEKRVDSEALSRVVYEILTSLRVGANLSSSLAIIADDVNFDIRMKLKEYSEKLNAFIMIYTFLAILAPVILLTMLLAASVVIGDLVPGDLILVLYSVFFPMIIVFLGLTIKKLEPKI
jgi:flagellar protein FlaJ